MQSVMYSTFINDCEVKVIKRCIESIVVSVFAILLNEIYDVA